MFSKGEYLLFLKTALVEYIKKDLKSNMKIGRFLK